MRIESKSEKTLQNQSCAKISNADVFSPFMMSGFVSLTDKGSKVPVFELRDTAASQSLILEGVLPLSDKSSVHLEILVTGFGVKYEGVPLHTNFLETPLVKGKVVVGVRKQFPVEGVSFILGNDLAEGKV